MNLMLSRLLIIAILVVAASRSEAVEATQVESIIDFHIAAIGGADRIQALTAFRGGGHVMSGGERLEFEIMAARPNRLRMTYHFPNGRLVQVTDGIHPPWEIDTRLHPTRNRLMNPESAGVFLASADFDDPLIAAAAHGDVVEFAGNTMVNDRSMIKLLVTRRLSQSFFLVLDAETYCIVSRIDPEPARGGERAEIVTEYHQYRPVGGVLAAHEVIVRENGRITDDAILDWIESNPSLRADTFSRPSE